MTGPASRRLVSARYRVVARWAALILIGVATGGLASLLGGETAAILIGAVVLFVCGVIVAATIWATYMASLGRSRRPPGTWEIEKQDDLVGAGLFWAVALGFLGAGVLVGGLTSLAIAPIGIVGAAGAIVLMVTRDEPPREAR